MNHLAMLLISAVLVKGQAPNHILSMEEGNLQVFNNGTSTQGWVSNRGIVVYVALFLVSLIFGLCTAYLLKFGYRKFSELKQLGGVNPLVIDTNNLKADAHSTLCILCKKLNIPFFKEQLSWSAGPKPWIDG
jgi:hypothetical protein